MWPAPANSYVLKDARGAVLVDAGCGFPGCYQKIKEFLSGLGLEPRDVHTVVLTHAHPDHMGAMPFLLAESSPRIIIHALEEQAAADNSVLNRTFDMRYIKDYYGQEADVLEYFSTLCPMGAAVPTDTVAQGDVLDLGGRSFEVLHTPGHSPGHISLFDRENRTLLPGDVFGAVVAWYCPSGGGARGYLESLDKLEALDADVAMPSHGPDITAVREAIEQTRSYILARDSKILTQLASGPKSLIELTDELFPNPGMRLFPGIQITDSHLMMLVEDGVVVREEGESVPVFRILEDG